MNASEKQIAYKKELIRKALVDVTIFPKSQEKIAFALAAVNLPDSNDKTDISKQISALKSGNPATYGHGEMIFSAVGGNDGFEKLCEQITDIVSKNYIDDYARITAALKINK